MNYKMLLSCRKIMTFMLKSIVWNRFLVHGARIGKSQGTVTRNLGGRNMFEN